MRKLAPAFILSSIVALASGSALALGDMNKNKKAANTDAAVSTSQPVTTSPADKTYTAPTNPSTGGAATASDTGKGGASGVGPNTTGAEGSSASTAMNSTTPDAKAAMKAACKGLTPNEAAYQQNKCGNEMSEKLKAGNQKGGSGS